VKIGDLVRTCNVEGYPLGLIVGVDEFSFGSVPRYKVLLEGRSYPFMAYQLQLIEVQNAKT
jgi:hypothetical protein